MARPLTVGQSKWERRNTREAEFECAAMPHREDLFRIATRMTRDRTRAEDAVQETFLQAWKSFDNFTAGTNCRAWLFRILFHCVQHQRRKWFRFPQAAESDEILRYGVAAAEPTAETLSDEAIKDALDALPDDFRAVALLVDVEEFAYREAAQILDIPIGTVMSRLSRARSLLRARLAETARSYGLKGGAR